MKSLVPIIAVTILITGHAGAATNSATLVHVDSRDFGDTNSLMKIVECERGTNTSKLRLTYQKRGSSVGGSMFVVRGFYEVAKARKAEYFVNLKEWEDEDGGAYFFIAGFANTKDVDLKKEFGEKYSYEDEFGQKRNFMSVSEFKVVFEWQKSAIEPGGSAYRSQPVRAQTNQAPGAAGFGR